MCAIDHRGTAPDRSSTGPAAVGQVAHGPGSMRCVNLARLVFSSPVRLFLMVVSFRLRIYLGDGVLSRAPISPRSRGARVERQVETCARPWRPRRWPPPHWRVRLSASWLTFSVSALQCRRSERHGLQLGAVSRSWAPRTAAPRAQSSYSIGERRQPWATCVMVSASSEISPWRPRQLAFRSPLGRGGHHFAPGRAPVPVRCGSRQSCYRGPRVRSFHARPSTHRSLASSPARPAASLSSSVFANLHWWATGCYPGGEQRAGCIRPS